MKRQVPNIGQGQVICSNRHWVPNKRRASNIGWGDFLFTPLYRLLIRVEMRLGLVLQLGLWFGMGLR